MVWQDNGQGTYVNLDHVAKVEFDRMGVRVFVPKGGELHLIAGGSHENATRLRAVVAGPSWVRVRRDDEGGDEHEHYANLALASVVEFEETEEGPAARIVTLGGAPVGQAHLPDALERVRDWVSRAR